MIDADNDSDNDNDDNIGDINDDNNGDINDAEDDDNNSDINDFYPLLAKAVIPQAGFLHKIFSLELFFFPPDDNPDDNHNNNPGDNNNDHPDEGDGDDGELSHSHRTHQKLIMWIAAHVQACSPPIGIDGVGEDWDDFELSKCIPFLSCLLL